MVSLSHMVPPVEIVRMVVIMMTSAMLMNSLLAMKHKMIGNDLQDCGDNVDFDCVRRDRVRGGVCWTY